MQPPLIGCGCATFFRHVGNYNNYDILTPNDSEGICEGRPQIVKDDKTKVLSNELSTKNTQTTMMCCLNCVLVILRRNLRSVVYYNTQQYHCVYPPSCFIK